MHGHRVRLTTLATMKRQIFSEGAKAATADPMASFSANAIGCQNLRGSLPIGVSRDIWVAVAICFKRNGGHRGATSRYEA